MIVIAESGSTKCDWIILDDKHEVVQTAKTPGFNPYFHDQLFISSELAKSKELVQIKDQVNTVFFYGAGCSSEKLNTVVLESLSAFFSQAEVSVDHDLVAAAYALYQGEPVIGCIIGTGSNSCFFDGQNAIEKVPALGFILGDEASGSYFGKRVLADYIYKRLPGEMQRDFDERFHVEWAEVVQKVYQNPHANVYLASFMRFVADHKDNDYVQEMVKEGMARFIDIHVANYSNYHRYEVGFVGAVAYVFQDILREELRKRDCRPGLIIKHPADQLVKYHKEHKLIKESLAG
jgi:N-acetylglucosamine kinase-like BadF-type ATPase